MKLFPLFLALFTLCHMALSAPSFECKLSYQGQTATMMVTNKATGSFIEGLDEHEFLAKCSPESGQHILRCNIEAGLKGTSFSYQLGIFLLSKNHDEFSIQARAGSSVGQLQCSRIE